MINKLVLPLNQINDFLFCKAETVAYAAHCQQEEQLDRPVAGHTNICPGSIKKPVCNLFKVLTSLYDSISDLDTLISVLKHSKTGLYSI